MITGSVAETIALGRKLGSQAGSNTVFCLFGELGSGKTTLVKGIVEGATNIASSAVVSPTFLYLTPYVGDQTVYHFDLYRLKAPEEFVSMGFMEIFDAGGITCIEWSERIVALLPPHHIKITLTALCEGEREIVIDEKNCI